MAMCLECLGRRVRSDLTGSGLSFVHGLSDSLLPFASSAVVKIASSGPEQCIGSQKSSGYFVLVVLNGRKTSLDIKKCENNPLEQLIICTDDNQCAAQADSSPGIEYTKDLQSSSSSDNQQLIINTITKLTPVNYLGRVSTSEISELMASYMNLSIEQNVINSLNMLCGNKVSGSAGLDFLSFVGFSAFDDTHPSGLVRHPNILPVLGVVESSDCWYMLQPKAPYTLENIMHYSPEALCSDWHIRFVIYQIISAMAYLHDFGVHHGNLKPSTILMSDSLWPYLSISDIWHVKQNWGFGGPEGATPNSCCVVEGCSSRSIYASFNLSSSLDWSSHFKRWWAGELSNYEYLLVLNKLAGRRWGDPAFHPVMPWVIDFTVRPDENSDIGWRDLTKSKWRLAKGDEQLDFTYSSSDVPHHVSDECLSELAVCSYKARRLSKTILRSAVRSVYEPNEYPSSMQRLYQWTPDECIPDFYSDPWIFVSLHSEMSDLALPSWVTSSEEFICLHRDALESDRVSQQLHHWIDINFGYKLAGEASIEAKNVMLPPNDPSRPKSIGRRQLFTKPHPKRSISTPHSAYHNKVQSCARCQGSDSTTDVMLNGCNPRNMLSQVGYLEEFEQATLFMELEQNLNPIYSYSDTSASCRLSVKYPNCEFPDQEILQPDSVLSVAPGFDFGSYLECFESDDSSPMGYQELLRWKQMSYSVTEHHANDIFSIGCILAEIYLRRPLFDASLLAAYRETGMLPGALHELPVHVAVLVESCIQREWKRRPSSKQLLESPYFPPSVRSAYMFLAPLQLLCTSGDRLKYVAKLASEGALKAMGTFSAEMCAPYCLPFISPSLSDVDTESGLALLKEFLKCLSVQATKELILPIIQKILQAPEYSHLKVSLLQDSFVRELWKKLGKQTYIEKVHPLVIANLYNSTNKITASAASVVLIGSSEELGIPITVHQTVLPLIHCFGKGLCADGIETLVRIGGLLGESFIVKQILPLLRNVILLCIDSSKVIKTEPQHSWNLFALIDGLSALEGLVSVLPVKAVLRELLQDQVCLYIKVLMLIHSDLRVIQVAAAAFLDLCLRIGPDNTVIYVLPHLRELFAELAFSHDSSAVSLPTKVLKISEGNKSEPIKMESRIDLVFLLYPFMASLVGIEKLRECCSTWFLLEQSLQRLYNWKLESFSDCSRSAESMKNQRFQPGNYTSSEAVPAKLLFNGAGWSVSQSEITKTGWNVAASKHGLRLEHGTSSDNLSAATSGNQPWFWFPSPDSSWGAPDFLGRSSCLKDELPWKIKASVLYSARAHPGALRSLAVHDDECTVFTGGVGPGFKGSIQRWELPNMNCTSGYYGHEEVVNSISILSITGKIASCDGTIHIWNGQTGKLRAAHTESSTSFPLQTASVEQANMVNQDMLSGGILSTTFRGSLYTTMHYMASEDKLVAGMGNGSIRFIDISRDQKLHLWKSDSAEISFSSLVSAICSCGSDKQRNESIVASSSWIAAGLSSGYCRLLDERSGQIIAAWRAHDGHITKLASPEDHLIVSSSLDKTLRIWDLRRNSQADIYRLVARSRHRRLTSGQRSCAGR